MWLNCLPGRQYGGLERHLPDLWTDLASQPTVHIQASYSAVVAAQVNILKIEHSPIFFCYRKKNNILSQKFHLIHFFLFEECMCSGITRCLTVQSFFS